MADKKTHFGRAGELFAMSELLLRGWNVAVPVVDVGDDVFVIDDNDKTTWRLQVKSATAKITSEDPPATSAKFRLSRAQLSAALNIELLYMLMVRLDKAWRFLVIPRPDLAQIRADYLEAAKQTPLRGRPSLTDDDATTDALGFEVTLRDGDVTGWGASLIGYTDTWPAILPEIPSGPGAVARANPPAEDPAP